MIIGLDYDGTITSDPEAFFEIAKILKKRGHKVYIVTMRYASECLDIPSIWSTVVDGIYPTGRMAKNEHMLKFGIKVDVWIDDEPRAIHQNAEQAFGGSSPEGVVIIPVHN